MFFINHFYEIKNEKKNRLFGTRLIRGTSIHIKLKKKTDKIQLVRTTSQFQHFLQHPLNPSKRSNDQHNINN